MTEICIRRPVTTSDAYRRALAVTGRKCSAKPTAQRFGIDDGISADAIVCAYVGRGAIGAVQSLSLTASAQNCRSPALS